MSADFLHRIINHKQRRIAELLAPHALERLREAAARQRQDGTPHLFRQALRSGDQRFNIIAEYKRASPSKGIIRQDLSVAEVAQMYEAGGAVAMSVLTEQDFFKGSLEDLLSVKSTISLPVLRKDFTIHAAQIYEAADAGADAVLLIVAALSDEQLADLRRLAEDELHLDALVEVHTLPELERALQAGANIIGVNNRDLRSFDVSLETSLELIKHAPADVLMVSESGLASPDDLQELKDAGFDAFLIGETLMRATNAKTALQSWLNVH